MEYTSYFTPIVIIFISLLAGMILGVIFATYMMVKESKALERELDVFRELYFKLLNDDKKRKKQSRVAIQRQKSA